MKTNAVQLLQDILSNTDEGSIVDFLEIQCGFTDEEAQSWIAESKEVCKKPERSNCAEYEPGDAHFDEEYR